MEITKYEVNKTTLEEGTWLTFDKASFLLASSRGKRFQNFIARKSRKLGKAEIAANPGIFIEITNEALAEVVLLDWKNVTSGGTAVPCTPENKRALIGLPEFRDWLTEASADMDNFRAEAIAQDAEDLKSLPALESGVE